MTFRGFEFVDLDLEDVVNRHSYTNRALEPMDHSDTYKPQGISAVQRIKYEDTEKRVRLDFPGADVGAAYMYNIVDFDGSAVGRDVPTIIGSHINWWDLGCDCALDPVWNTWLCDLHAPDQTRDIAMLHVSISGLTRAWYETDQIESHRHVGFVCQHELEAADQLTTDDASIQHCMILTKNPTTTGVSNRIWYWRFFGGGDFNGGDGASTLGAQGVAAAPGSFTIDLVQIPRNRFVVSAFAYPKNTQLSDFTVSLHAQYHGANNIPVPLAPALDALLTPTEQIREGVTKDTACPPRSAEHPTTLCNISNAGPLYYWDATAGLLYLRVVDAGWYNSRLFTGATTFERNGAYINGIQNLISMKVDVACTPMPGTTMCAVPDKRLPAAARPSGDSCAEALPSLILPARLTLGNTAAAPWQLRSLFCAMF